MQLYAFVLAEPRERLRKCVTLTEFSHSSREVNASRALKLSKSGQPSSTWSSFLRTPIMEAKMQNGSSKTGRGVTVNGTVSTLKRQPRPKTASGRQERGSCSSTSQEGAEQVDAGRRDSLSSQGTSAASTASSDLEQKIEEKLKFSQFLDEVTCRVLDPECLQAFGAPIRRCPQTSSLQCLNPTPVSSHWFGSSRDSACDSRDNCQAFSIPDRGGKIVPPARNGERELNEMICLCLCSWLQEQKEDLRRRLGCTTHKLQQLQSEFESTRQYLETELRRAQDQLDKLTEKLRRIQSSYTALQRINQDTEEKIHRMTQRHEEEKRSLSREIVTLKNHLMEDKISIQKLREDNVRTTDALLNASIIHRLVTPSQLHQSLPADLQERVSSHMQRQGHGRSTALHHSFSDAVPTAVIGRVLEKPEPGRSCPVTRSPSPQAPEFASGTDNKVQRHTAYKSSDLYCSDTALYCPSDERRRDRWTERRQSEDQSGRIQGHTSTDGNLDDESFPLHEDPFRGFILRSLPTSSCSTASDEKLHGSCTDWRDGDYERKNLSSYGKELQGFPKSSSSQHVGSQNGRSGDRRALVPADPTDGWWQMSMEDVSRFSPSGFSEHHFKIKPGPLYSSFQDGDKVFHSRVPDPRFPASAGSSPALNPKTSLNALKAERGLISVESLNQGLDVQKYKDLQNPGAQKMTPRHQKFGNAGLSRKDSLTKAQLYGTLLN
uniref:Uncharacterized protein n=1 Tax=Sinocyclocheilus rhinocerous TaxID=307959 RepID=A0A673K3G1_9TELE